MKRTHEQAVASGRAAGNMTKAQMTAKNPFYYEEIGYIGGCRVRDTRGPDYYSRIAKEWRAKVKREAEQC